MDKKNDIQYGFDRIVGRDLGGFPYNKIYPPNTDLYGSWYHGYKDEVHETIFYEFAVQCYDISFDYKGKTYYCMHRDGHVALGNKDFTKEYQIFHDAVDFIENMKIDGHKLIEIISELENPDCY